MVPGLGGSSKTQIPLRKSLKLVRWKMMTRELIPFGLGTVHEAHIYSELISRIPTMVSVTSSTMTRTSSTMTRLVDPAPNHPEETSISLERLLWFQMRLARSRFATVCRIPMLPELISLWPNFPSSQSLLRPSAPAMRSIRTPDIFQICKPSPAFGVFRRRNPSPLPPVGK